jgi:hypothetical protein
MSYLSLRQRLESLRNSLWAQIETLQNDDVLLSADTATTAIHGLEVRRTLAAWGIRSVIEAAAKIERSLERDKVAVNSSANAEQLYEQTVSFAEQVGASEVEKFRMVNAEYQNALD